jgi:hypothetical protein
VSAVADGCGGAREARSRVSLLVATRSGVIGGAIAARGHLRLRVASLFNREAAHGTWQRVSWVAEAPECAFLCCCGTGSLGDTGRDGWRGSTVVGLRGVSWTPARNGRYWSCSSRAMSSYLARTSGLWRSRSSISLRDHQSVHISDPLRKPSRNFVNGALTCDETARK